MLQIFKPFGPSIAKVKIPQEMIDELNRYVDKIIIDEKKNKELYNNEKNIVGYRKSLNKSRGRLFEYILKSL